MTNRKVSFTQTKHLIEFIAHQMDGQPRPDAILALARGGLTPAVMLSHLLDIPVVPVSYSSKSGNGDDRNHHNVLPTMTGAKLLIVDDINDSGNTLLEVYNFYAETNTVMSAVLFSKKGSKIKPTYVGEVIDADSPFIDFPWELKR